MKVGKYETGILVALKDRIIDPGSKHPRRAFWWPIDGWITDPAEIVRAIRLDDDIGVTDLASERFGGDDDVSNPQYNDPVGNLEGDMGSSHMQGTPKAQGHEADNLSGGSAR